MQSDLEQRLDAVERLTRLFRFERMVYVSVCVAALAVLFVMAAMLLIKKGPGSADTIALFGPTGVITFTTTRLLRMWDRALDRIVPEKRR